MDYWTVSDIGGGQSREFLEKPSLPAPFTPRAAWRGKAFELLNGRSTLLPEVFWTMCFRVTRMNHR